ncbi:hypothetical protein Aperf_G00000006523 [Anoplocephala perfoliata]
MSKEERKALAIHSECQKWLLTVIVKKYLPQSAVKRILAFSNDYHLSYIPVDDSNPEFVLNGWNYPYSIMDILCLLNENNSDACQTFVELGGVMIVAEVIQIFVSTRSMNGIAMSCMKLVFARLLSCLAEFPATKPHLLMNSLMDFIRGLLDHPDSGVSSYASKIVSNIACLPNDIWISRVHHKKADFLDALVKPKYTVNFPCYNEWISDWSFTSFEERVRHPNSCIEVYLQVFQTIHFILHDHFFFSVYAPILRQCHYLQLIIFYVATSSLETLCNSQWPLKISLQDLPITMDKFGVLHCGPVIVPKSWRSFYITPFSNSDDSDENEHDLPNNTSRQTASPNTFGTDEHAAVYSLELDSSPTQISTLPPSENLMKYVKCLQILIAEIIEIILLSEKEDGIGA